jgi:hypothetical protein|tara:strand:- start:911 stop:1624 length:714 start_codon:yes stop_codon:yes gene_type:complete
MITTIKYNGAAGQDKFVLNINKFKKDGYFLEFGSQEPITANNTYLLESEYGWKGVMFEWEDKYAPKYEKYRGDDTSYIIGDAVAHDYVEIFSGLDVPEVIDYLQIDLEPGMLTPLELLNKLNEQVMDDHKFATITFEHDIYCGQPGSRHNVGGPWNGWQPYPSSNFQKVKTESRKILEDRGYVLVFPNVNDDKDAELPFEDWWVHPDLVDMDYVNSVVEKNKDNYNNETIYGPDIEY